MHRSKFNKVFDIRDGRIVLYNGLSSALDVVDTNVLDPAVDLAESSPELREYLRERGYVFDSEAEEGQRLDLISAGYARFRAEMRPLIFYLVMTYRCNFGCSYCFQDEAKSLDGTLKEKHLAPIFEGIHRIREMHPETLSKPVIALFGGEPLLRRHLPLVEKIFRRVADLDWVNGPIISNGSELDAYIPLFRELPPSGIQVTIDGPKEIHDQRRSYLGGRSSFQKIVDNVNRALAAGIKMGIRTIVDERNMEHLPEMIALAEEEGWLGRDDVQLSLAPVHERACGSYVENERHHSRFERLLELMRKHPKLEQWTLEGWTVVNYFRRLLDEEGIVPRFDHCEAVVGKSFHMDGYGYIYTCIEACGMSRFASGRFMPKFEMYPLFEEFKNRTMTKMEGCSSCAFGFVCGGGCGLQSLLDGEDIKKNQCGSTHHEMASYVDFRFSGRDL